MRLEPDISKTAGDKRLHSKVPPIENDLWVSNGHMTDVVTWPWKVKLVTPIRLERDNVENSLKCYLASR